jgi:hypothetical protein
VIRITQSRSPIGSKPIRGLTSSGLAEQYVGLSGVPPAMNNLDFFVQNPLWADRVRHHQSNPKPRKLV